MFTLIIYTCGFSIVLNTFDFFKKSAKITLHDLAKVVIGAIVIKKAMSDAPDRKIIMIGCSQSKFEAIVVNLSVFLTMQNFCWSVLTF